ncbi:MAG: hypothetical protein WA977_05525 [Halobacteriota archaeon]
MREAGVTTKSLGFGFIQEILSPLITGVIVVVVDWKLVTKVS